MLSQSDMKLAKGVASRHKRPPQSHDYLKAVRGSKVADRWAETEVFQEKVEELARKADALAQEIASLRWTGLAVETLSIGDGLDFYDEVRRFEITLILQALKVTGGSQKKSAALLKMNHTTLNTKIKSYRIKCETISVSAER